MNIIQPSVVFSDIDYKRFGIRAARANNVNESNYSEVLSFCKDHDIVLLIARCLSNEMKTVQKMQRDGFILMDTLIYYVRSLIEPIPVDEGIATVRKFSPEDTDKIRAVAEKAFKGYRGHYHADERLPQHLCDEAYADWAFQSCTNPQFADAIIVAEHQHEIKGFLTLKIRPPLLGEGILFGVSPETQGLGIGKSLMIFALRWFQEQGLNQMLISTQIVNLASQKIWARLGFEISHAYYTFHKWFDE